MYSIGNLMVLGALLAIVAVVAWIVEVLDERRRTEHRTLRNPPVIAHSEEVPGE